MKTEVLKKLCEEIMTPVRASLHAYTVASAQRAQLAELEASLEKVKASILAAPTAEAANAFVDQIAKIEARLTVARVREPVDRAAKAKSSDAASQAVAAAVQEFSDKIVEPLQTRANTAASRMYRVSLASPHESLGAVALPTEAWAFWISALRGHISFGDAASADRAASLEQLIPLLPAAFERVQAMEKAAAELAALDA